MSYRLPKRGSVQHSDVEQLMATVRGDVTTASTGAGTAYTAGSGWASPAPTTAQAAIDRLAAAVAGLLGTDIP